MDVLSNELKGQESNTLFIIGNGFDLFHNMKTSYWDFHAWLLSHNYADDFVYTMERLFPTMKDGEHLLWKDFEKALGEYIPKEAHDSFSQGVDDGLYDKEFQESAVKRIRPELARIPNLLRQWLKSLPISGVSQRLDLNKESIYMSFNYTMVLESVYYIPASKILHIHNSIEDSAPLITGHNKGLIIDDSDYGNANIEESLKLIAQEVGKLKKPVQELINKHQTFFTSLKDITHIVLFGQSLSSIDIPYFREVLNHVHDDAKWYFIVYDDIARERYETIVNHYNALFNDHHIYGQSIYRNKMKPENCKYIYSTNLT